MKSKKIFNLLLLLFLLVGIIISPIVNAMGSFDTQNFGIVEYDIKEQSLFDKILINIGLKAIIITPTVPKSGERINLEIASECGPSNIPIKDGKVNMLKNGVVIEGYNLILSDRHKNECRVGISLSTKFTFTAPNEEGDYKFHYYIKDTNGGTVKEEILNFKVQNKVENCPTSGCDDWIKASSVNDGTIYTRACRNYDSPPQCILSAREEIKTICNDGKEVFGKIDDCIVFEPTGDEEQTQEDTDDDTTTTIKSISLTVQQFATSTDKQKEEATCNLNSDCNEGECIKKDLVETKSIASYVQCSIVSGKLCNLLNFLSPSGDTADFIEQTENILKKSGKQGYCIANPESLSITGEQLQKGIK